MQDLRITLVQADLAWENPAANRAHLAELLAKHPPQTDIILLPEMFATGFSMNTAKLAETNDDKNDGDSLQWMRQQARRYNALVVGSLITKDEGKFYNRLFAVHPDGTRQHYDKRHLFFMAKEHQHYAPGQANIIVHYKGWRILPQVCYDLRFPVWSRNQLPNGPQAYDLLLYVANWPEARAHHWRRLLPARAIENLCYVAAVNRVGTDGKDLPYRGDSVVLDYHGETLTELVRGEGTATVTLGAEALQTYRAKFSFWQDADKFELR
jgi:predicted amidohydrolase